MKRQFLTILLRWFFAIVLIYAAVGKILHPVDFALTIEAYQMIGAVTSRWLAIFLPWLELLTGIFLIIPSGLRNAAVKLNLGMMILFLIVVLQAFLRGLSINCGCFSDSSGVIDGWKLLQNTGLLTAAIFLYFENHRQTRLKSTTS